LRKGKEPRLAAKPIEAVAAARKATRFTLYFGSIRLGLTHSTNFTNG
jgi:hypothetical protein